jgi:hypothetical protein
MHRPKLSAPVLAAVGAVLALGCEDKKPAPVPAPVPSATATSASREGSDNVVAYPPNYVPPADASAAPAPPEPKTGVCSFQENSYDGQDTRSSEKMVVKLKDDKIVAAEYRYRGSYALDGKSDSLDVAVIYGKWVEFELPMTTGTKKFQIRIKGQDIDFKGVATQDANGECVWKMANEEEEKQKDKEKAKAKDKKK